MNNRRFIETISESAKKYPGDIFSTTAQVYTCVNPFSYHIVRQNHDLYDRMDGIFVDGMTMCWYIHLFWGKKIPRLSFDMSGMARELFDHVSKSGKTIYFIGTHQDKLEQSIGHIRDSFPNMNIIGYRNGYFHSQQERTETIDSIVKLAPDYVIVGMGSPLQEQFADDLKRAGYQGIVFTCGGFLHQTAEKIYYYPDWINRYNLRAFYRLYKESGLFGRLYNVLIEFPVLFALDTIETKIKHKKR
jgi:N-acetylglucosaminyldiphosphoundecaprenol N-acetyl-beta-D-mannosaminyltransferase